MHRYALLILPLLSLACADSAATQKKSEYQTIAADPQRNTELARQENDRCLKYIRQKNWAEAEAAGKRALEADIMFGPAHNNLGRAYFAQNKLYLAAWEFQYAAKLMPAQPEPRNNLGLVCEAAGKYEEAQDWYSQSLALEPDNPELIGNAARIRIRRGDRSPETKALLNRVIATDTRPQWTAWARETLATFKDDPVPQ